MRDKIHAGFGLSSAHENAAIAGTKREDVAGACEVLRAGFFVNGGEDGDGAVGSADASGDAEAAVDGFAEGGAVNACVDGGHQGEIELLAALLGERQTDQAATELGHEINGFGGDFLGGHGEVAFVFAVFVIHQDNHAALADFFDGFFYGCEISAVAGHGILKYRRSPGVDRLKSVLQDI